MYIVKVNSEEEYHEKMAELLFDIDEYKAAQAYQIQHGGPGPVASYEVMVIVNEHNSEFEILIRESEV